MSMTSTKWILTLAVAMFLAPAGPALAQSLSLQQCANGPASAPRTCIPASAWVTGTVTKKNSHYAEGGSAPFRLVIHGLTVGENTTITFQWDTTEGGVHAYDYLTSYNGTINGTLLPVDPCAGISGCALGSFSTIFIPADPNVTGAGVSQDPGVFTMWGGVLAQVSYGPSVGTFAGRSSATITVLFIPTTPDAVLAWSGHLASPLDWGLDSGASDVSGTLQTRLYSFNGKNKSQTQSLSGVAPLP